jgi:hypothetical protein
MTTGTSQASTSAARLAYIEEDVFGVTPAAGNPKLLRMTGEDLSYTFTQAQSDEINDTRQVTDAVIVDAAAAGGFNFHAQYAEYDTFIEALLCNTFSEYGVGGVKSLTLTFDKDAGTIAGPADAFTGLVAGQFFSVKDSEKNDGFYRIGTVTSTLITVDAGTPLLDDESATTGVKISSTRITNGTADLRTFSIEKVFTDVGQYFLHKGRAISSMELNFAVGSILSGSFGTVGKSVARGDTTGLPGELTASQAFGITNSVTGVGSVLVRDGAGASILGGAYVNSMNVTVDGTLREQKALGNLGAIGIGKGTFNISGTLEIYLVTGSVYDAALADQLISVAFPVVDAYGNGYAYTFANVKLNVPDVQAGAKDQDVLMSIPFTAVAPNTTIDRMVTIDRFGDAIVNET